ncbi:MAG TPA: biopolymer transporter ExbD [Allocoleopsis sp.]
MKLKDDEEDLQVQINIIPMINVIFALVAFLMMSSLYLTRSQGLPVNLPNAITGKSQTGNELTLTIYSNGNLTLNRDPIDLKSLERKIKPMVKNNQSILIIINADKNVSHGKVVEIMDKLRLIEGVRLAIATTIIN